VTTTSTILPSPPPEPGSPLRRPAWLVAATVLLLVASVAFLVLHQVANNYFALSPGTAPDVGELISVPPNLGHARPKDLYLVTVALRLKLTPFDFLFDQFDSNTDVVSVKSVTGGTPRDQLNQVNDQLMSESQQVATAVALRRLGYRVMAQPQGAEVAQVVSPSGADGHLQPGDVITAIDGKAVTTNNALVTGLRAHHPGDVVKLTVDGLSGLMRTETVTLGTSPVDQGPAHAFLGVSAATKVAFVTPFKVSIDSRNIGGPSAGLAFTLGLIDALSPKSLTGGHHVAATGTIDLDGSVGQVGGVAQKTAAVRAAGAEEFLVPAGEYDEARRHAGPHLKVVKVATLDEALQALQALGGDLSALSRPTT
jgi:PDZ domain-containing protein